MAQLLLATNLTPNSDRAVDRAKLIATLPGFEMQVKQRRFESKLRAALPGLMGPDQPISGGLDVIVERGDPTEVILRKAEELEPDLTAFGLGTLIMGSTAQVLVEHLDCDLLVANAAQPEPDSESRIVPAN